MIIDTVAIEKIFGLNGLIDRAIGRSTLLQISAATSAAEEPINPFVRFIIFVLAVSLFLLLVLIQNIMIGFIAVVILVHYIGLDFRQFFEIFPASYVYLTFFNRLGIISIFARAGVEGYLIARMFFAIFLLLPAAYFMTRYGIRLGGDVLNITQSTYADPEIVRRYVADLLQPTIIGPGLLAALGVLMGRPLTTARRSAHFEYNERQTLTRS